MRDGIPTGLSMLHVPIDVDIETALDGCEVAARLHGAKNRRAGRNRLPSPRAGTRSPLVSMTFTRKRSQKWPRSPPASCFRAID